MVIALTREVSPTLGACQLTHVTRVPIDVERAAAQHRAYEARLEELGCRLVRLPPLPDLPDAVFVEDTAVIVDELAVTTRPGAPSRRGEVPSVGRALGAYRRVATISPPATLDGGDVLRVGRTLFVGRSTRSNADGIEQLRSWLAPSGYAVEAVTVTGCLHLKSAATLVAPGTVLVNPHWVDPGTFAGLERIEVDPGESHAANALMVGGALLYPEAFPATRARLEAHGLRVVPVDLSELAKAEGAVTCCSLLVEV
jgi:dimethylargininase